MDAPLEVIDGGVRVRVRAQPRASRSELAGEHGGALKVRLAAPPVNGAANDELVTFLAKTLGLPRAALTLVAGERGRQKVVEARGIDIAAARRRLGLGTG